MHTGTIRTKTCIRLLFFLAPAPPAAPAAPVAPVAAAAPAANPLGKYLGYIFQVKKH